MKNKTIIEFGFHMIWRILQIKGVFFFSCTPFLCLNSMESLLVVYPDNVGICCPSMNFALLLLFSLLLLLLFIDHCIF